MNLLPKKEILGIKITDASKEKILEYISSLMNNPREKQYIVTPNPEIVMYARKDPSFIAVLNQAHVALCDGMGLWIAGRILGKDVHSRVTGIDLMEELCERAAKESKEGVRKPISIGLLGAGKGVALRAAKCLSEKYPGLHLVFVAEEWGEEGFANAKKISNFKFQIPNSIDILFVAFGFPKQEQWMAENLHKLPVTLMMGVGGAFDYISGNVPRAPKLVRSFGFEWLYRLVRQPWRLSRQLVLPQFLLLVLKERFK